MTQEFKTLTYRYEITGWLKVFLGIGMCFMGLLGTAMILHIIFPRGDAHIVELICPLLLSVTVFPLMFICGIRLAIYGHHFHVTLSPDTLSFGGPKKLTHLKLTEIKEISDNGERVRLVGKNGKRYYLPQETFDSVEEHKDFVDQLKKRQEHALRSAQAPPQ